MADKQVYELTLQDLLEHGVWYFPMDDTVEDELTVRPAGPGQGFEQDYQVIVRTTFESREGSRYLGYLYWHASAHVCDSQPVVFVGNSDCIAFWSGIATPSWADYPAPVQCLRQALPLVYASQRLLGLEPLCGVLEGLYGLEGERICLVK